MTEFDFALELGGGFANFIGANLVPTPAFRTSGSDKMRRQKPTIEQKWKDQAETYRHQAAKLPYGKERDELLRKARQLDTASRMNDWLSSPGLSSPT